MPKFLEDKLKAEYPNNPHAVYGTMNSIGAMRGNKETALGREMQAKHEAKLRTPPPRPRMPSDRVRMPSSGGLHPGRNLGKFLHPKKGL